MQILKRNCPKLLEETVSHSFLPRPETSDTLSGQERREIMTKLAKLTRLLGTEVIELNMETGSRRTSDVRTLPLRPRRQSQVTGHAQAVRTSRGGVHDFVHTDTTGRRRNTELAHPPAAEDVWPFEGVLSSEDLIATAPSPCVPRARISLAPEQISTKAAALLGIAQPHVTTPDSLGLSSDYPDSTVLTGNGEADPLKLPTASSERKLSRLVTSSRCSLNSLRSSVSSLQDLSLYSTSLQAGRHLSLSMSAPLQSAQYGSKSCIQQLRHERRRRADKMSRWLGSIVPAHLVGPNAQSRESAYMLDEQPFTPFACEDERDISKVRKGFNYSNLSVLGSRVKRHSSLIPGFRVRSKDQGGRFAVDDGFPLNSESLTGREHYEIVRRSIKLDHLLGVGAGAAACRFSTAEPAAPRSKSPFAAKGTHECVNFQDSKTHPSWPLSVRGR